MITISSSSSTSLFLPTAPSKHDMNPIVTHVKVNYKETDEVQVDEVAPDDGSDAMTHIGKRL